MIMSYALILLTMTLMTSVPCLLDSLMLIDTRTLL